LIVKNKL